MLILEPFVGYLPLQLECKRMPLGKPRPYPRALDLVWVGAGLAPARALDT